MKSARHQAILDLIEKYPIDRQEDLLAHLRQAGFEVTQATVSRDIRELRLIKTAAGDGSYRPAGLRRSSANRLSVWITPATWFWSNVFPAWPMPLAKCLTPSPGIRWSGLCRGMILFSS